MGGQAGCKRRIEVKVKIQKKKMGGGGPWGGGSGWGGQGGCERRFEVFVKIQKKNGGGRSGGWVRGGGRFWGGGGVRVVSRVVGGVRVDVNEELKFL